MGTPDIPPQSAPASPASRPVRRRTLSQAITEELAERIREGTYSPGDALPTERELMDQFGVGRSAARETMQALAAMGLIDIRPGRGARVLSLQARVAMPADLIAVLLEGQAVEDLYEFRGCAEVEVAGLAAARATAADLDRIAAAVEGYRDVVNRGQVRVAADVEFHRALAAAAHNVVFEQVLDGLTDLLNFARREVNRVSWVPQRTLREHARIAEAIAAGDRRTARAVMRRHIDGAVKAVRESRSAAAGGPGTKQPGT